MSSIDPVGLLDRRAVAMSGPFVQVLEIWDPASHDLPMCSWPRGSILPNPCQRKYVMHRREAEQAGLIPRTN